MEINDKLIKHVSGLSRLDLSDEEIASFSKDFESILSMFEALNGLDTTNTKPSFHPIEIKTGLREDRLQESRSQDEALSNVSRKKDGFIIGPKQ